MAEVVGTFRASIGAEAYSYPDINDKLSLTNEDGTKITFDQSGLWGGSLAAEAGVDWFPGDQRWIGIGVSVGLDTTAFQNRKFSDASTGASEEAVPVDCENLDPDFDPACNADTNTGPERTAVYNIGASRFGIPLALQVRSHPLDWLDLGVDGGVALRPTYYGGGATIQPDADGTFVGPKAVTTSADWFLRPWVGINAGENSTIGIRYTHDWVSNNVTGDAYANRGELFYEWHGAEPAGGGRNKTSDWTRYEADQELQAQYRAYISDNAARLKEQCGLTLDSAVVKSSAMFGGYSLPVIDETHSGYSWNHYVINAHRGDSVANSTPLVSPGTSATSYMSFEDLNRECPADAK